MSSSQHPHSQAGYAAGAVRQSSRLWLWRIALGLVFVAAAALRLAASLGDLVLDEVWSWHIAAKAGSTAEIFATYVDNNHILNTLVLYAWGPRAPMWAYRLPAVLAGTLALGFGFALAKRQGTAAAFNVLVLLGLSHILILHGTEARGYGYLICFTLAAWWALENYLIRPRLSYMIAFGVAASLGILSHATFVFAYLAFGIYSVWKISLRRGRWQLLVMLNALPVMTWVFLLFYYFLGLSIGGGHPASLVDTLLETLSLMAGGREQGAAAHVAGGTVAALIVASLVAAFRSDRARGILFLTAIVLAPAAVLAVTGHSVVYPRYFLVPMIFAYVAVGTWLSRWHQAGRIGPCLLTALLICYTACNLGSVVKLIRQGRGQYSLAMQWMAEHTFAPAVTVASDHDFRNGMLILFYDNRETLAESVWGKGFIYVPQTHYRRQGTEWFLRHSFSGAPVPPESFVDAYGNNYALVKVFPAGSISGWTWWLYRRAPKSK